MSNTVISLANSLCFPGANVSYDVNETAFINMEIFYKEITFANTVSANGSTGTPGQVLISSGSGVYWGAANSAGNNATVSSNTATTSSLSQITVDAFPISTFRTVKYLVQIVGNNGDIQASEIIASHNGSVTFSTEYATVFSNVSMGILETDISAGNFRLLLTPVITNNTIKLLRTTINI